MHTGIDFHLILNILSGKVSYRIKSQFFSILRGIENLDLKKKSSKETFLLHSSSENDHTKGLNHCRIKDTDS